MFGLLGLNPPTPNQREETEDVEKNKLESQNKGDNDRLAEVRERLAEEEDEVHASPSSIAASKLTSITLAPFSTCCLATLNALS